MRAYLINARQTLLTYTFARIIRSLAHLGFLLTIVLIPFRFRWVIQTRPIPPVFSDYTDFLLFAGDIALLLTLLAWLASYFLESRPIRLGPWFISLPLAVVTLLGFTSSVTSVDPALSLYHSIRLILLAGLYVYVVNEITSLKSLGLAVMVQVVAQSIVGIMQVLNQRSLGLQHLGELVLDPTWEGVSIIWAEGSPLLRAYGLTDHPNILGGCLAFGLLMLTGLYMNHKETWRKSLVGVYSLVALGLLLTYSRSAWLALASGLALLILPSLFSRQRQVIINLAVLSGVVLMVLLPFIWRYAPHLGVRLNVGGSFEAVPQEMQSLSERQLLNRVSNQLFAENALLGVGLGALPIAMSQQFPDFPANYQPAHFVLLVSAAETGILGGTFYAILMLAPWLALWVLRRRQQAYPPELILASAMLLAATMISFFDYYTWSLFPGRMWQWLIWGLWGNAFIRVTEAQHP
jgi:O-antigen ligase